MMKVCVHAGGQTEMGNPLRRGNARPRSSPSAGRDGCRVNETESVETYGETDGQARPNNVAPIRIGQPTDDGRVRALAAEYGTRVERRISRLVGNKADALDVAQRTWIRVAQALPQLRDQDRPLPWLMRIASRCSIDWLRENHDRARKQLPTDVGELTIVDMAAGPSASLLAREQRAHLLLALGELHEVERWLLLGHVSGTPYARMAQLFAVSADLLAVRVWRIRKRLGASLETIAAEPVRCGVTAVELLRLIPSERSAGDDDDSRLLASHTESCAACSRRHRLMFEGALALREWIEGPRAAAA